jgi:hypothetical protein
MRTGASLALLLSLVPAVPLAAQAALSGTVREDSTGRPIPGVEVLLEGSKRHTVTDWSGKYLLTDLPTGVRVALFRYVGYRPLRLRIRLAKEDTLLADTRLVAEGVTLDPIEVTGRPPPPRSVREGFEERRRNGTGIFIDSAELRRSEHVRLADVLRRNNVDILQIEDPRVKPQVRLIWVVANRRGGARNLAVGSRNAACVMKVILDGITAYDPERERMWPTDINTFSVSSLESVEVYRSRVEIPMEFSGSGTDCGIVVLWTRRR